MFIREEFCIKSKYNVYNNFDQGSRNLILKSLGSEKSDEPVHLLTHV